MSVLVLHDTDAVNIEKGKTFVHWVLDSAGKEVLRYMHPIPPPGTGQHTYRLVQMDASAAQPFLQLTENSRHNQPIPSGDVIYSFTVSAPPQSGGAKKRRKTVRKRR